MIKRVGKRGDTLIEVMMAVGIFSLVAIAVVAVMNGGTSSAQTSLEATLTREEIDTQAEALRFVHAAYIAEKESSDGKYGELWRNIVGRAINSDGGIIDEAFLQYSPSFCDDSYGDGREATEHGFVVNPRKLGTFSNINEVVSSGDKLVAAVTYPHLIYNSGAAIGTNTDNSNLVASDELTNLYLAEGIYVIAVKDPGTTNIVGEEGSSSAYYDFYIRTCWYGTGDQNASTISTLIRLYDPEAMRD